MVGSPPPEVDEDSHVKQIHAGRELTKGDNPKTDHRKGADSKRDRILTAKQGRLLHQRHSFSTPRCRTVAIRPEAVGVETPCCSGPLTTSLGDCGSVATCPRAMADREQGRRPENRPCGDDSDPGLSSRRD